MPSSWNAGRPAIASRSCTSSTAMLCFAAYAASTRCAIMPSSSSRRNSGVSKAEASNPRPSIWIIRSRCCSSSRANSRWVMRRLPISATVSDELNAPR
ncbi:MAG: hypothetical protein M5U08_12180 [Burkholderiales bacterium]|nr:hypothetical protein [Burkholderiales bacterium]